MADVTIDAAVSGNTTHNMRSVVWTTPQVGYFFFVDGDVDLYYKKTLDGGRTWGENVTVQASETIIGVDVWYDQWTPGDTGRLIHIWYFGTAADDIIHKTLNTASDTLSSNVIVFNGATAVTGRGVFVSGAKMRSGYLYCCFDIDAGAELGLYRSTDNGATWSARTNMIDASGDQALVFPGNDADPNDAWILYHDSVNNELSLKVHDDSANTNSEALIVAMTESASDATGQYGFSGAIRFSDGHLICALITEYDATTQDFLVYDINGTASITQLTAINSNTDDHYYPGVYINQRNDYIYVAYIGNTSGAEVLGTTASVYYARSKDRGLTWTKNIAYSEAAASTFMQTWVPVTGPKFAIMWRNGTPAVFTNVTNAIDLAPPSFNNYLSASGKKNNTGILSFAERIR